MTRSPSPTSSSSTSFLKAGAGALALAVAMGIGRFAFTPVLPMMLADRTLSIAQGGWLASANYLGYLIGALAAVAVRIAPERAVRIGLFVIGMVTCAMGLHLSLWMWLLLRLVAGIASAWVLISVSAWSMDVLAPYNKPSLNSMVFAGVGIGIAAAGLLCLALTSRQAHGSAAWILLGVLSLAATAVVWPVFRPVLKPTASLPSESPGMRWDSDTLRLVLSYGLFGFGYIIPATFLPVMAKQALQDAALFGWAWPLFGMAGTLSTLAVAPLVRRIGHRPLWMWSHLVMALGIALPALSQGMPAVFAAALCVGGTFMVITLAALQEARRAAGSHAPVLIAAMTSAFAAGQIIGPLTVSWSGSFNGALLLASLVLTVGALLLHSGARLRVPH